MTGKQPAEDVLTFEYELDAPPAKVWRALTVPEFVSRWLPAGDAKDRSGSPLRLELLEFETGKSARYAFREAQAEADDIVTFLIDANAVGGTTFRIVHQMAPALSQKIVAANSNRPALLSAA